MLSISEIIKTDPSEEDQKYGTLFNLSFIINEIKFSNIKVVKNNMDLSKITVRIPRCIELNKHQWWFIQDHFNDWYKFEIARSN